MHATNRSDKTHFVSVLRSRSKKKKKVREKGRKTPGPLKRHLEAECKRGGCDEEGLKRRGEAWWHKQVRNIKGKMKEKHGSKDSDGSLRKAEK